MNNLVFRQQSRCEVLETGVRLSNGKLERAPFFSLRHINFTFLFRSSKLSPLNEQFSLQKVVKVRGCQKRGEVVRWKTGKNTDFFPLAGNLETMVGARAITSTVKIWK